VSRCRSSRTSVTGGSWAASAAGKRSKNLSSAPSFQVARDAFGTATPARRSAAPREDQNTPGPLSDSSKQNPTTAPVSSAAHDAIASVLPAPGGPVTTVSGHHRMPATISSVIRGRRTAHGGKLGVVTLDARIGSPADADRPARNAAWLTPLAAIGT